jgi:DNA-binding transcriptional regulator YiaG
MKKMNIKELRTLTGMSQSQFADYFHIPKATLQNWEQGRRECPEYVLKLIEYKLKKEGKV